MTEEIITKRSIAVSIFFAEARKFTEMIDSLSESILPALNGQTFIAEHLRTHASLLAEIHADATAELFGN